MSISKRIRALAEGEYNQSVFADKVGLPQTSVSRMINRDGQVRSDSIESIAKAYPNLNLRWLLTGEGPMWLDGPQADAVNTKEVGNEELKRKIDELNLELKEKDKLIDRMTRMMEQNMRILEEVIVKKDPDAARQIGLLKDE